ncbi:DNA repair endonuclease XPF [Anoplophora glabripennis]|uniref:DNA repair endonuclease XPF n=1 Tax=Anoplophora glabripennis TaxID=217634 RepID=UPI000875660D|nr:DNA repair endonuclease XPF [Anoplophora glabripennis]
MTNSETDNLLRKADLQCMLEFETQIFLDIVHTDGLVIAAKGLHLNLVIFNILKVYCDVGNLVIVLNATEQEEKYYRNKLSDPNIYGTTCSTSTTEREDIYLSGGIHFVTTRILVVDMLKKRVPIDKITGFIILRAHTIFESCQEAFVLRLYRQNNKTGFIKAFSNSAQSFIIGFGHVERVMRTLFIKELYIWPRFHSLVIENFKRHAPQVVELHVPISEKMKKIQTHILDLMNLTVKELKRINNGLELQEISVENCLTKKFHKILQAQLDVVWHQLSAKSCQLLADLKTLRHLILTMLFSDSVTFYNIVSGYRTMEYAQSSSWVLLEPAELLFSQSYSLVYNNDKEFDPEFCLKWEPLLELLKVEIPNEMKKYKANDATILILCSDNRTCYQLNKILTFGPHDYLLHEAIKRNLIIKNMSQNFIRKTNLTHIVEEKTIDNAKNKKIKAENSNIEELKSNDGDKEDFQNSYVLTMSQSVCDLNKTDDSEHMFEPFTQMENMNLTQICESLSDPKILIQTFGSFSDCVNLQNTLENLKPTFIIMYHCSMTCVREIEMYVAHMQKDKQLKVYFLVHADTVEEQSYLTTLRREKEAFEFLIQTKSNMVVPQNQDEKTELSLQNEASDLAKNTREGGKPQPAKKQIIIVDMREFRSELPPLIHKRGIDIEPLTITVGDYILTPEICVERKSLSDLIGSLNSGRLYQQCTQMSRYYSKPMLLIEFDQNKQFGWQNNYMLSNDANDFNIQQKLLLLTLHFPKLKIIWSPSPYASAQLFEELKLGKDEPNIEYAAATGGEQDFDVIESKFNSNIYDFVQKLPGITSKNMNMFLRKCEKMDNVIKKSEEELKEILGNASDAKTLYSILHESHKPNEEIEPTKPKGKTKSKFKYYKNKK